MRRDTMDRLMAAIRNARAVGAEVSESGQPRGERRIYTLRQADGTLMETPDLGRIEKRIAKLRADQDVPVAIAPVKVAKTAPAKQFDPKREAKYRASRLIRSALEADYPQHECEQYGYTPAQAKAVAKELKQLESALLKAGH